MTTRTAGLALVAVLAAPAGASVAENEREILEAFYHAANGTQWRRNDGWLEPGSDPCDWFGIDCERRSEIERDIVHTLDLSGNNLSGTLDARIFEVVHVRLDLSDNAIGGSLELLPASPGRVDLSNNRLEGKLPADFSLWAGELTGTSRPSANWYLDLSHNRFDSEIPQDWRGPTWLSLAGNRFEGSPDSLLEGTRHPLGGRFLDLSDNRFSGDLPVSLMESDFLPHDGSSRWGGGLNLCWNEWAIPESVEFQDWLRQHHVGGEFQACLSSDRHPIDPTLGGSWYDPGRSGEGNAVQVLDNGMVLNYFFTFDEAGKQQWLVGAEPPADKSVSWRELLRTRGRFGSGLLEPAEDAIEVRGSFRVDRLDADRVLVERVYIDRTTLPCLSVYPPPLGCMGSSLSDRREYRRLTHLAASSCEHHSDFQEYSGAWYDPERSGEGFVLEVLADNEVVVYWFTYQPDDPGQQAWMVGSGFIEQAVTLAAPPPGPNPVGIAELESMYQPAGGRFGAGFDPAAVEFEQWGRLTLELLDDGSARVEWDSLLEGFGTGTQELEQLARPMLAECD